MVTSKEAPSLPTDDGGTNYVGKTHLQNQDSPAVVKALSKIQSGKPKPEAPGFVTKVSSLFDGAFKSRSFSLDPALVDQLAPTKTQSHTLKAKQRTLQRYPELGIEQFSEKNYGRNLILQGTNSIKAEVLDMLTMGMIMEANSRQLTHSAVDRFYDWLSLFALYIERYFFVEEDVMISWLAVKTGPLRGAMKTSARTLRRGKIQKALIDIVDMHSIFVPSLPAGERIGRLTTKLDEFARQVVEYVDILLCELPGQINGNYSKSSVQKLRRKWVTYVVDHVGSEDFLVLYTRWMKAKDLRDWKTKILLLSEFKYFSYTLWQSDMQSAHFQIASCFSEILEAEVAGDTTGGNAELAEFVKPKITSRPQDDEPEVDEGSYDEEESSPGGASTAEI